MKKVTFALIIINLIMFIGLFIFPQTVVSSKVDHASKERAPYLNIMASNKPTYLMIKKLVKDRHNVEFLLKSQEEIKNYTFNDDIVNNISRMNLFVYSSDAFEPWAKELISNLDKGKTGIIDLSRGTKGLKSSDGKQIPYYWMDFDNYKIALFNIKSELQTDDLDNRNYYEDNYNDIVSKFESDNSKNVENIRKINGTTFYYADNTLEYYSKYLNSKSDILDSEKVSKIITEKKDIKPFIVFYEKDETIESYKNSLITKGAIFIKVNTYNGDKEFADLLTENINNTYNSLKTLEESN
ncbi:metal ABC transporter solute-binding protein, Zn/Mn family [Clostridium paridis]|uniref:Zinc ABC transporter substrate-binding protein n=1 Tax=Clostridium paridis TaxID=2803863 RepID=A0A937FEQ6_9CLOT|nr:zinc ABC transporter substrate-binding protein [Clostridium paridis]